MRMMARDLLETSIVWRDRAYATSFGFLMGITIFSIIAAIYLILCLMLGR